MGSENKKEVFFSLPTAHCPLPTISTPARIRTRNATFEAWNDVRFTTRASSKRGVRNGECGMKNKLYSFRVPSSAFRAGTSAEGEGVEPSRPRGRHVSRVAAVPVPHTLPIQWSRGELNPDAVLARHSSSPLASPS